MVCDHLKPLEEALISAGFKETYRGRAWTRNCREWVYFDCYIPLDTVREKLGLEECVKNHSHLGTHDGQESGFECSVHHDGVMGHHPNSSVSAKNFTP